MAASSKFDTSSSSPDKTLYASGQRGSYTATLSERSSSFREGIDNPILSALPNMSRSSSAVTQGDVKNFFQCLRYEPKLVAAEHKGHRQGDLKRLINSAFGASVDDTPSTSSKGKLLPSPLADELKQCKGGVRESSNKARERTKMFSDALSTFNKCFPSIPSRKRSRLDAYSSDRSNVSLSSDRSLSGSSMNKMGSQNHAMTVGFELEQQKAEERAKSSLSKRTRTSMVDVKMDIRPAVPARPPGAVDKDREILRLPNSGSVQGEDRALSIGVDGWEKSKMKKKRSAIKPDVAPGSIPIKPTEGYREPKHGLQQRLITDARSRLNDSHGFRSGVSIGAVDAGKPDGISQQTGSGVRSSVPRIDQDNGSLLNDRRDRPVGSDKERVNVRAVNKVNVHEDFCSASPTSNMKITASTRAPRSGSSMVPKLSPVVHRAAPNDWEFSHCANKPPAVAGANNRKGTPSTRSASPPVAHWTGQRQKLSRTARRTNFVPIVSSHDESPALDTISDAAGIENGLGPARRMPSNSPQQVKFKGDHLAALSESEESAAADIMPRDKIKKSDDVDEKTRQNSQKSSTPVLSSRKNKMINGEDLGDGVRRQGRTGRGFTSTRSLLPVMSEKLSNMGTAKQLRSARLSLDKSESKAGRPPTRKLSDRKAYTRQRHAATNAPAELLVGSDNGHEELLAAANAVINPDHAFSSSFWRHMEPFFKFISDADIGYLKRQGNLGSAPATDSLDVGGCHTLSDDFGANEGMGAITFGADTKRRMAFSEQFVSGTKTDRVIPLCQRLIAALIPEEENEEFCSIGNEYLQFDVCGTGYEPNEELESSSLSHQKSGDLRSAGLGASNGYLPKANGISFHKVEHGDHENEVVAISNTRATPNLCHPRNGLLPDLAFSPAMTCSELQYNEMSMNERLLLEIQSIGIFPDILPDGHLTEEEEISENIAKLEDMYHGQVSKNKSLLSELMKSASETKEHQEKEFEHRALDKLVGMAYEKYMACWGPNASGGKSSTSKMAKQAALAFVKRTLERCREFEDTGKSCFSDSIYRDMFFSGSSRLNDGQSVDTIMDIRVSASGASQQNPSLTTRMGQNMDNHDTYSSGAILPVNNLPEQLVFKEDTWSNRVKKRELLLDDVGGTMGTPSVPSGIGGSLSSSTKGKRSERDREGKGHRELLSRNGNTRVGRPALSNIKGERKSKSKPKQKTTQLSASVNGLLGKMSEQPKATSSSVPKSNEVIIGKNSKDKDEFGLDEPVDLSGLQLPGIDDDLGDQGQDLSSWLNIDDDGLQDHDFMGLEIPMDDLSDLNMMV